MADLSYMEKNRLEKLFNMKGGYVLNFTDRTFQEFVLDSTGLDIYDSQYEYASGSKANRLRAFWSLEPNSVVGKLIQDLLNYLSDEESEVAVGHAFETCRSIATRLLGEARESRNVSTDHRLQESPETVKDTGKDSRNVFVVHGRNLDARNSLFRFLRSIGLKPLEWTHAVDLTEKTSPYIGEVLDAAFANAQAVVVLMTPDDEVRLREAYRKLGDPEYEHLLTGQSRPNVLFEAGMAMARDSNRTVLIELGNLKPFSDIGGRHVVRLDNSVAARQSIANRLKKAGCAIDLNGTDWHTEGDFDSPAFDPETSEDAEGDQPNVDINAIFARLSRLAIHDDFFLYFEVPPSVLKNAYARFVPVAEDVMAFLDNTEACSGRSGVAFTNSGMFWRNSHTEGDRAVTWEELQDLSVVGSERDDEVRVGDERIDLCNSEVSATDLANTLRDIISLIS